MLFDCRKKDQSKEAESIASLRAVTWSSIGNTVQGIMGIGQGLLSLLLSNNGGGVRVANQMMFRDENHNSSVTARYILPILQPLTTKQSRQT